MKTITYNQQTLEISDEDFEQLQKKYAKKSRRFEPEIGETYKRLGAHGTEGDVLWNSDYYDRMSYVLGNIHNPNKPFDLEREKARIDLLYEVTKLYHKHVDPLEWKREFKRDCYYPYWGDARFDWGGWGEYTACVFSFPRTDEGKSACLAFANEVGIDRWKQLCDYGIL